MFSIKAILRALKPTRRATTKQACAECGSSDAPYRHPDDGDEGDRTVCDTCLMDRLYGHLR